MLVFEAGVLAAEQGAQRESLLDILPWWWARLIVGIVLIVIAVVAYAYEKRNPESALNFGILGWVKTIFALFGVLLVFESIGIF